MIDFKKIISVIDENDSFLITTHFNPDGDAIGSEIAFYYFLMKLNKKAAIYNYSPTPSNLQFLDPDRIIKQFDLSRINELIEEFGVLTVLDLNHPSRIIEGEDGSIFSQPVKICIDHHENPENFTDNLFVDKNYGSTAEIIFDFIDSYKKVPMDLTIAQAIYTGLMTDSGSFRFERTCPSTHLKAAKLLELGVDPKQIHLDVYAQGSVERLRLLGRALDSLSLFHSHRICTMVIRRNDLTETSTTEADIEDFVNYTLSIKGVKIGLLFYELDNGFKVSFRSIDNIPINKLAIEFNGGGHFHAAGTRIFDAKLDEFYDRIVEAAKKYL